MSAVLGFINFLRSMGASAMLPVILIIIGLIVRVPIGRLVPAALTAGVGFIGIFKILDLLSTAIAEPTNALIERFGLNLTVIDTGWPSSAAFAWGSDLVPILFIVFVAINIVMLLFGLTKTLNVDIWNFWGMFIGAAFVQLQTGNILLAIIAGCITCIACLILADLSAPLIQSFLPGISLPHSCSLFWFPFAWAMNKFVYTKIPGFRDLKADPDTIKEKIGLFGDPMIIGVILGALIAILGGCSIEVIVNAALNTSATLAILPKMVAMLMEGLTPIANGTKAFVQRFKVFEGKEIYIGIDGGILMSRPSVIVVGVIMIPITLLLAVIVPGNQVLPMADLGVLTSWLCWTTTAAEDNIFRGLVTAILQTVVMLLVATDCAEIHTTLANSVGYAMPEGFAKCSSLCMGQELLPWLLWKISCLL